MKPAPLGCDVNNIPDECELDTDGDGAIDECGKCTEDPIKTTVGDCGCGVVDSDADGDTIADCIDQCPGYDDRTDANLNGTPDCVEGFIPAVSSWGLGVLGLLLLVGGKAGFRRHAASS